MGESAVVAILEKLTRFFNLSKEEGDTSHSFNADVREIETSWKRLRSALKKRGEAKDTVEEDTDERKHEIIELVYHTQDLLEDLSPQQTKVHKRLTLGGSRLVKQLRLRPWLQYVKARLDEVCTSLNAPEKCEEPSDTEDDAGMNTLHLHDSHLSLQGVDADAGICSARAEVLEELIQVVLEGGVELTTVTLVAMGGMGKTTLARHMYNDESVKKRFECHAWVPVVQASRLADIYRCMIKQFHASMKEQPRAMDGSESVEQLAQMLQNYLAKKRYIIVLDAVWHVDIWESIKYTLPNTRNGSRIILTTRDAEVVSAVNTYHHVHDLRPLDAPDTLKMFSHTAFGPNETVPGELEGTVSNISRRCRGIPLVTVIVAGLMSTKRESYQKKKNESENPWLDMEKKLGSELKHDTNIRTTMRSISLAYDDMPDYLKSCFLYFGMFPSNIRIRCSSLLRIWLAEEFLVQFGNKTLEEVGEEYIKELAQRHLIEVVDLFDDGRIKSCRVHNSVREFILSKYVEENFGRISNKEDAPYPPLVRRLSVQGNSENLPQKEQLTHLRCFNAFGLDQLPRGIKDIMHGRSRYLRVLDLMGTPVDSLPSELAELVHLRYLGLRKTKIQNLPKCVSKLKKLETLDLKETLVTEVPAVVFELQKLRHLLVYSHETKAGVISRKGVRMPQGIGELAELQSLSLMEVRKGSGVADQLQKLAKLRRLAVIFLPHGDEGKELCASVEKMTELRSFKAYGTKLLIEDLKFPPPGLERICLRGDIGRLPDWFSKLGNLVSLCLRGSGLKDDPFHVLKDMNSLEVLTLNQAYLGTQLCCKADGLKNLKVLNLVNLEQLHLVAFDKGAMHSLKKMIIEGCTRLRAVPEGVEYLKEVFEELDLYGMPPEFQDRVEKGKGEDFPRISHIRKISLHKTRRDVDLE